VLSQGYSEEDYFSRPSKEEIENQTEKKFSNFFNYRSSFNHSDVTPTSVAV
jgi:hypothetical protein